MDCKLCGLPEVQPIGAINKREFQRCQQCGLVFVSPSGWLSPEDEKLRYSQHNNGADNREYVQYLTGVSHEIDRIPIQDPVILDFGSGKEFVLTRIMRDRGYTCASYDPVYDLGLENLTSKYDVLILSETIEHLRNLDKELRLLKSLCKPQGYLFIQTQLIPPDCDVVKWWYASDAAHINFFNDQSLAKAAGLMGRGIFYSDGKSSVVIGPEGREN